MKKIHIAGGCFWGVQHYFSLIKGIEKSKCVYINSEIDNITYEQLCSGLYKAIEGVELEYDESVVTLSEILEFLFRIIDPNLKDQQGNDYGYQYNAGVFYLSQKDKDEIDTFITNRRFSQEIFFMCTKLINSFDAETNHQNYLVKNPSGYCHVDMNKIKKEERK